MDPFISIRTEANKKTTIRHSTVIILNRANG